MIVATSVMNAGKNSKNSTLIATQRRLQPLSRAAPPATPPDTCSHCRC
jgi:hypothetical protein